MKIRKGFVSNSSSSSFVVAFEKPISDYTLDEIQQLLFGDKNEHKYYDTLYTTREIAEQVKNGHRRLLDSVKMFSENQELLELIMSGWYEGKPEHPNSFFRLKAEERQKVWDIYHQIDEATAMRKMQDFIMSSFIQLEDKSPVFYVFEYSDNDGEFIAMMEHSGIFDNLPHMVISHH